jgi:hypothetical protein
LEQKGTALLFPLLDFKRGQLVAVKERVGGNMQDDLDVYDRDEDKASACRRLRLASIASENKKRGELVTSRCTSDPRIIEVVLPLLFIGV